MTGKVEITDQHINDYLRRLQSLNTKKQVETTIAPTAGTTPGGNKELLAHPYRIHRIKIKDPEYMSQVPEYLQNKEIPGFPTTVVVIGEPGSGKTNLLMNMLTRKDLWNQQFDKIYALGPTVKSDKLYQSIQLPDSQKVTEEAEFIDKLTEWVDEQKGRVKDDPAAAPKCLFLFEDFTSYRNNVQTHPNFLRCFNAIRHHKATAYANVHKIAALERTARLNCRNIIVFPVNKTEQDLLYQEYGPSKLSKADWYLLCEEAWTPDESTEKPFLYINKYQDMSKRFRKCFTEILNLDYFKDLGKVKLNASKRKRKLDQESQEDYNTSSSKKIRKESNNGVKSNDSNSNSRSKILDTS